MQHALVGAAISQLRAALLPPDVRELPGPARQCPGCGRLYWLGSHARRMREALERVLPGWLGSTPPTRPRGHGPSVL